MLNPLASEATSLLSQEFSLGLLLSVEAYRTDPTAQALSSLISGLQHSPLLEFFLFEQKSDQYFSINDIKFSPDAKILASISSNGAITLWDVQNHSLLTRVVAPDSDHARYDQQLMFSADGTRLVSAGSALSFLDPTIIINTWDISDAKNPALLKTLKGDANLIESGNTNDQTNSNSKGKSVSLLALRSDNKIAALAGPQNEILLWDISGSDEPSLMGNPLVWQDTDKTILCAAFSPNGKMLASGNSDKTIMLWDISNPHSATAFGKPLFEHNAMVESIAFSHNGKLLASGGNDNSIILWDISNPKSARPINLPLLGHKASVTSMSFSPDDRLLVSGGRDNNIILWDVSDSKFPVQLGTSLIGHEDAIYNGISKVSFSPDGTFLASASDDIIIWNIAKALSPSLLNASLSGHKGEVDSIAFSPNGKIVASGGEDKNILLWDLSDSISPIQLATISTDHKQQITSLVFSPDGRKLASSEFGGAYILWDIEDPHRPLQVSKTITNTVQSNIAFSPDGKLIAAGGGAKILLWDASSPDSPRLLGEWDSPQRSLSNLGFTSDGSILAAGMGDSTIVLLDVRHPEFMSQIGKPLIGHTDGVASISFSPDGHTLASGSYDTNIILWNVSDPLSPVVLGTPLTAHKDYVWGVNFTHDGKMLVSGSLDSSIILWDVSNPQSPVQLGMPLTQYNIDVPLTQGAHGVNTMSVSPDGKLVAAGTIDGYVNLWDIDVDSWLKRACRIANRNLSNAEWLRYLGDMPYHKTCPENKDNI